MNICHLDRDQGALRHTIEELYRAKEYRPTVVVPVFNSQGSCLIGRQGNPEQNWSLVQEGIKPGENTVEAALRGLSKELGIEERHINEIHELNFTGRMPFPPNLVDTRGYTRGKFYFGVGVFLHPLRETDACQAMDMATGPGKEILEYRWLDSESACRLCVLQSEVPNATEETREKGRRIQRPLIRMMIDVVLERIVDAKDNW